MKGTWIVKRHPKAYVIFSNSEVSLATQSSKSKASSIVLERNQKYYKIVRVSPFTPSLITFKISYFAKQ